MGKAATPERVPNSSTIPSGTVTQTGNSAGEMVQTRAEVVESNGAGDPD